MYLLHSEQLCLFLSPRLSIHILEVKCKERTAPCTTKSWIDTITIRLHVQSIATVCKTNINGKTYMNAANMRRSHKLHCLHGRFVLYLSPCKISYAMQQGVTQVTTYAQRDSTSAYIGSVTLTNKI